MGSGDEVVQGDAWITDIKWHILYVQDNISLDCYFPGFLMQNSGSRSFLEKTAQNIKPLYSIQQDKYLLAITEGLVWVSANACR